MGTIPTQAAAMEADVLARRKRVEEWRAKRLAEQQAEQAADGTGGTTLPVAAGEAAANGGMEVDGAGVAASSADGAEDGAKAESKSEGGEDVEVEELGLKEEDDKQPKVKGWSLEDDEEDDAAQVAAEDGMDVEDPLDAFMKGNDSALASEAREEQRQGENKGWWGGGDGLQAYIGMQMFQICGVWACVLVGVTASWRLCPALHPGHAAPTITACALHLVLSHCVCFAPGIFSLLMCSRCFASPRINPNANLSSSTCSSNGGG